VISADLQIVERSLGTTRQRRAINERDAGYCFLPLGVVRCGGGAGCVLCALWAVPAAVLEGGYPVGVSISSSIIICADLYIVAGVLSADLQLVAGVITYRTYADLNMISAVSQTRNRNVAEPGVEPHDLVGKRSAVISRGKQHPTSGHVWHRLLTVCRPSRGRVYVENQCRSKYRRGRDEC